MQFPVKHSPFVCTFPDSGKVTDDELVDIVLFAVTYHGPGSFVEIILDGMLLLQMKPLDMLRCLWILNTSFLIGPNTTGTGPGRSPYHSNGRIPSISGPR